MRESEEPTVPVKWSRIGAALKQVAAGEDIVYAGAASQYRFSSNTADISYGETDHEAMDTWVIKNGEFVRSDSIGLLCQDVDLY